MDSEEVILKQYSESWGHEMPVTLITHDNGAFSLHCQTGDHHRAAIEKAMGLLSERGLTVGRPELLGPTGLYYSVRRLSRPSQSAEGA